MSSIENSYNRPNFPYKCGRAASWGIPCPHGPTFDGSCGGVTACTPALDGDRYSCRRARQDGGACENGPLPDGSCCLSQPACRPVRNLRNIRSRLNLFAAFLVVALIGVFGTFGNVFDGAPHLLFSYTHLTLPTKA